MSLLFAGIEVPKTIKVYQDDIRTNHHEIVYMGETLEEFIMRGIATTAFWGDLLRDCRFSVDFKLGVFVEGEGHVLLFDPGSEDFAWDEDEQSSDNVTIGQIDHKLVSGIQAVSGYYDIDSERAMSTGIHLRGKLLREWDSGNRFAYTPNGTNWTVCPTLDPWDV